MNEKYYIEEIIAKNISALNDYEPAEGHFERFETKLKLRHRKKNVNFRLVLKVAAAVIFVFLATNQAIIYFLPGYNGDLLAVFSKKEITLSTISPEYSEVEFYYTNAINVRLNQWNKLNSEGYVSDEEKLMVNKELAEFEEHFKNLQQDLAANPSDERVINAILEYYQAKLSIINMIVEKLQEVKQQKNNDSNKEKEV